MARVEGLQAKLLKDTYKDALKKKGYAFFESGKYNVNIIGTRASTREGDNYDDSISVIYKDRSNEWVVDTYQITTDPGVYYLANESKWYGKLGVAVLVPNQYRGTYMIGPHGSTKYEALIQRGQKVKIYRDNNKDEIVDIEPDDTHEGWFGINIHASSMNPYKEDKTSTKVGPWSAGCQVFKNSTDFQTFMKLIKTSAKYHGDKFTYTLLDEEDLA